MAKLTTPVAPCARLNSEAATNPLVMFVGLVAETFNRILPATERSLLLTATLNRATEPGATSIDAGSASIVRFTDGGTGLEHGLAVGTLAFGP
ncbi:MAG: hypothetical protein WC700_04610 [Gemmatimonadaceae bacterium]|jgi:hypothetical protein